MEGQHKEQSSPVVRGRNGIGRVKGKEQGRKITDSINNFNTITELSEGMGEQATRNRILSLNLGRNSGLVVEQNMGRKRKAQEDVEKSDVERKLLEKRIRPSLRTGSSSSTSEKEKDMSII